MLPSLLPLFVPGIPGGLELLVIALVFVLLFGVPLALVAGFVVLMRARRGEPVTEADVEELHAELAEIRQAVEEMGEEDGVNDSS